MWEWKYKVILKFNSFCDPCHLKMSKVIKLIYIYCDTIINFEGIYNITIYHSSSRYYFTPSLATVSHVGSLFLCMNKTQTQLLGPSNIVLHSQKLVFANQFPCTSSLVLYISFCNIYLKMVVYCFHIFNQVS